MIPPPPSSTLFPYTTLFRSLSRVQDAGSCVQRQASMRLGGERGGHAVHLRSEEHTSELQSHVNLVCRLLLEKKKTHQQRRDTRPALAAPLPRDTDRDQAPRH